MPVTKLEAALVSSSHGYHLELSEQTTVRQLATYLSEHEARVATRTLELAQPVPPDQALGDIHLQAGDRLLIFAQLPRQAELPAPVRAGDTVLKFTSGDYELRQHGKHGLLVGRPDELRQTVPDVDLRYFVAPEALAYISRGCIWLNYVEDHGQWFATRMGQTRVMINEYELLSEPMALNPQQHVRLYRASDDLAAGAAYPLGEFSLTVDIAPQGQALTYFSPGSWQVGLRVGHERARYFMRSSASLALREIATALAAYDRTSLLPGAAIYIARLLAPDTRMAAIDMTAGAVLYAATELQFGHNVLRLVDVHRRERVFTLAAAAGNEQRIGFRAQRDISDTTLAVDLRDALIIHGHDPRTFQNIPRYLARVMYRSEENSWWILAEDRLRTPLYLNNARLTTPAPAQLMHGDVLTLGPSISHYYARVEVEISASAR